MTSIIEGRHRADDGPEPVRAPVVGFRRYQISPDGRWYRFRLGGNIVAAGTRHAGLIEFWTLHREGTDVLRELAVVHDERQIPPDAVHLHTIFAGLLVWHLIERPVGQAAT